MPQLQSSDIGDLIKNTLNKLNRGKFTNNATDRQQYWFTSKMVRQAKVTFQNGKEVQWNRMIDFNEAEAVGLYAIDNVRVKDVMDQASLRWAQYHNAYAIDHREITRNSGESKIVDMLLTRRLACTIGIKEKFEQDAWRVPASTDKVSMFGFPYWFTKNNTEGFNGGRPSGYTTVAGIDPNTDARWKNWTAQYTSVSKDDLVRKMSKASRYTKFMSPVDVPDFDTGEESIVATNYAVESVFRDILEAQNDNLGTDLDPMDGRARFQRMPIMHVFELDADTTNPVYGIPLSVFKLATESGWWMKEDVIEKSAKQHTVSEYHLDCTGQLICYDRRRGWVIATNTGLPA